MDGLKQRDATGKSRRKQQQHRAIPEVGKTVSPIRSIVLAGRNVIRVSCAQPCQRQRNRNEQDTARQGSSTPVEHIDQEINHRRKEKRAQRRSGQDYANDQPTILCVVMLRYKKRDNNESTSSLRQPNHDSVPQGELPQILRNAHAKETRRHQENSSKNDPARTVIIGQFTEQDAADAP